MVGGALLWEVAEKLFLLRYSVRMPPAIGREALIGLPVTAVSARLPERWVKLRGERWKARCSEGAGVGDSFVIEAVEGIALIVAQPRGCVRGEKLRATELDCRASVLVSPLPRPRKDPPCLRR